MRPPLAPLRIRATGSITRLVFEKIEKTKFYFRKQKQRYFLESQKNKVGCVLNLIFFQQYYSNPQMMQQWAK